jgi:hypothetical protein
MVTRRAGMSSAVQPTRRWTYSDLVALPDARSITVLRRPRSDAGLIDATLYALVGNDVLESPLFPGLKLRLRNIFRPARAVTARTRPR